AFTRIILRTGQPGYAPEREVVINYDINDYKTKTELTSNKLFVVLTTALRNYETLSQLNDYKDNLEQKVKQRTEELRVERNNLTLLIENTRDIILSLDETFQIIVFNSAAQRLFEKYFQISLQPQQAFLERLPLSYQKDWQNYFVDALQGESVISEEVFIEVDNTVSYFEIVFHPIVSDSIRRGVTVFGRDVTERKALEENWKLEKQRAEEATLAKDRFLTLVSHDLKSPLSSMISLVGSILDDPGFFTEEEKIKLFSNINSSSKRLLVMVERLLNITNIQSGKLVFFMEDVSFAEVAKTILTDLQQLASDKEIRMESSFAQMPNVLLDRMYLQELVKNLLANAIKFTNPQGWIEVKAYEKDKHIICKIQDSGVGIHEDKLKNLLKQDIKTTTIGTKGEKGYGVGLPFCNEVVRSLGGTMLISSKQGEGTQIEVVLPKYKQQVLVLVKNRESFIGYTPGFQKHGIFLQVVSKIRPLLEIIKYLDSSVLLLHNEYLDDYEAEMEELSSTLKKSHLTVFAVLDFNRKSSDYHPDTFAEYCITQTIQLPSTEEVILQSIQAYL
ncbi:MAG: HAMP domain-containing sensor histidine kinase, partial [Spirochaetota bacterium]